MKNLPAYYKIHEKIGKGAFSSIYRAFDEKEQKNVAIKVIKKQRVMKIMKQIRLEISLLHSLDHPNIVTCFGSFEDKKYLYIILEYCEKGDLSELLKANVFSEQDVHFYFSHLVSALKYLHTKQIIHRDIKPKNILVSNDNILKLTDFGFAKHSNAIDMNKTICGSPLYMAPEILSSSPYSTVSDLWSIGIVLFEMISGRTPYYAENIDDLQKNIQCASQFDLIDALSISNSCKQLLFQLLDMNQSSRLSWEEFFQHTWITGLNIDETSDNMHLEMETRESTNTECQFSLSNHILCDDIENITPIPPKTSQTFIESQLLGTGPETVLDTVLDREQGTHSNSNDRDEKKIPGSALRTDSKNVLNTDETFEQDIAFEESFVIVQHPSFPMMSRLRKLSSSLLNFFYQ